MDGKKIREEGRESKYAEEAEDVGRKMLVEK